jgi:crotonobetainyl-CoA:carnitine CoA-transferase CaiB-like acyl-CoA transferase
VAERISPLAGVVVVDLSRHLPGPLAARLLSDLGARVIKVEEPRLGDPVRQAPPRSKGVGALAALLLSGCESIALDLKLPGGREVLDRLLERADVLLESFRPGTLARLGFAPETLRRRFPRLVIASLTGWGQTGPYAPRAGHDLSYQALAGTLASTVSMPNVPVADITGAWTVASAVLAALYERERTGEGRHLDASLYEASLHSNLLGWAAESDAPVPVGRPLPLTGGLPCYHLYRTADGGWLAVAALEIHFWERFCKLVGREDLKRRLYSTAPGVRKEVAAIVRARTRAEWVKLLAGADLPIEPVLSAAEACAHPQAKARALLGEGPDGLPRAAFPVLFDGRRPRGEAEVPALGGNTDPLLTELGLAGRTRRALRKAGVGRRFEWRRWLLRIFRR